MRILVCAVTSLVLAASALAGAPPRGLVVPGSSFGGLRLGMTKAQVTTLWGTNRGVCRDCAAFTWYYNYAKFAPEGAGVRFRGDRVSALWTTWSPPGWHTNRGLTTGDSEAQVTTLYGALTPSLCSGYSALMLPRGRAVTSFYLVDGKLWGFGLSRPGVRVCH